MDPTTAWEHPGFASSDPAGVALAAVKADATLADLVLWDAATGDTIIRAFGPAGKVKFQTSAGAAIGIAWADVSKVGSSLADLAVRDASALDSGILISARLAGAYTGITAVGTLTGLALSGALNFTATAIIQEAGVERGRIASGALRWGTTVLQGGAGEIVVANGKRIGCLTKNNTTFMGIEADATTNFVLNINTGSAVNSGGYLRIPRTTAPPAGAADLDGVIGINETNGKLYYISGGVRREILGT